MTDTSFRAEQAPDPGNAPAVPPARHRRRRTARRRGVVPAYDTHAILAILILVPGTALAVACIPQDVQLAGALFWPACIMVASLAIVPLISTFKNTKNLFLAHHLLVLAPIYWLLLDLVQKAYDLPGVTRQEAMLGFLAIGLFVMGVWIGELQHPWRMPEAVRRAAEINLSIDGLFAVATIAFVLGMGRYAIPCGFNPKVMWENLFVDRWSAPWTAQQFSGWEAFRYHLGYFGFLLSIFAVALGVRTGWFRWRTLLCLAMSVIMSAFLAQEGGRREVGVFVGMGIVSWVLMQKKQKARTLVMVSLSAAALLFTMQTILYYRNAGFEAALYGEDREAVQKKGYIHVDDNFLRLCQTIGIVPESHPYVHLQFVYFVLVRPIPRVFWPGKPINGGYDAADAIGEKNVSLSMSAIGELYLSWGMLAVVFGGWFYGRLARMSNELFGRTEQTGAVVLFSTMTMALFVGVRSLLDLILISYVVLAWIAVCWLYNISRAPDKVRHAVRTRL
jgi:hypothetical protein